MLLDIDFNLIELPLAAMIATMNPNTQVNATADLTVMVTQTVPTVMVTMVVLAAVATKTKIFL